MMALSSDRQLGSHNVEDDATDGLVSLNSSKQTISQTPFSSRKCLDFDTASLSLLFGN